MNKKILISSKEMEITVLEEKGAEITETLEMSFEDAKDLIFENNNKVGHIEIRSEKPFDTSELALAMLFDSWAYFPSGMGMAGSRIGVEFTAEGEFTLRMPEKTVIFHKELEDPYGKKGVEMLNRYSRYLKAVFNGKNEFEIDMEYPVMAHVNDMVVLENGKISCICIYDKETAEDVKEWKEKMETAALRVPCIGPAFQADSVFFGLSGMRAGRKTRFILPDETEIIVSGGKTSYVDGKDVLIPESLEGEREDKIMSKYPYKDWKDMKNRLEDAFESLESLKVPDIDKIREELLKKVDRFSSLAQKYSIQGISDSFDITVRNFEELINKNYGKGEEK